ncbi:MAG: protein phosphatase 2C domain-containing protein [Spirochaetales bacterium]|jgi:serine/threonine protein phosphatase PrpC|nr:protein phosphatase 2C domain-containing protein [Spirochaetales bacterium]
MKLAVTAICDIGCKRGNNEDMILVGREFFRDTQRRLYADTADGIPFALAVADGMGGLERGEEASAFVLSELAAFLSRVPQDLDEDELTEVFTVFTRETHSSLPKDSGSTLVGLLVYREKAYRFHAGDSRLYQFRQGRIKRLTKDHSLREMGGNPSAPSNIILNCFGGGEAAFIEFAPLAEGLRPKDTVLLSSDGLHDLVSTAEIEAILTEGKSSAEKLVAAAKAKGGKDNISVIYAQIEEV